MPGMMDKLKDTFGKAKDKFDDAMDSEQVEKAKVKASGLASKASATAKETYGKVSEKAKDVMDRDGDDDETIDGPAAAGDATPGDLTETAEATTEDATAEATDTPDDDETA